MWNLAAERLLGVPEDEAMGQLFWTLHVPAIDGGLLQKIRKSMAQNAPLRAEQLTYEVPNGSQGHAMVMAIPILDNGTALGALVTFEDATRVSNLTAEVAALKANNNNHGRRTRR